MDLSVPCHGGNIDLLSGPVNKTHHQLRVVYFHILCYFLALFETVSKRRKDTCQTSSSNVVFVLCTHVIRPIWVGFQYWSRFQVGPVMTCLWRQWHRHWPVEVRVESRSASSGAVDELPIVIFVPVKPSVLNCCCIYIPYQYMGDIFRLYGDSHPRLVIKLMYIFHPNGL